MCSNIGCIFIYDFYILLMNWNIAALCSFGFHLHGISFCQFHFKSLCVLKAEVGHLQATYSEVICGNFVVVVVVVVLIHSATLSLLIEEFSPLTFKVPIGKDLIMSLYYFLAGLLPRKSPRAMACAWESHRAMEVDLVLCRLAQGSAVKSDTHSSPMERVSNSLLGCLDLRKEW